MDRQDRRAIDSLASELRRLHRRLDRIEDGGRSVQLANSSLEDSSINTYDDSGTVRQVIGRQVDGTVTLVDFNGTAPPAPTGLSLIALPGGFRVGWDGTFEGGATAPLDFQNVEIHIDLTDGFTPDDSTIDFTIPNVKGGRVNFVTDELVPHHVRLVAVNTSGVRSVPSAQQTITPVAAGSGISTFFGPEEPTDPEAGSLWVVSDDANKMYRFDGADWISVRDEGINQAIQAAAAAQADAADAIDAAATAQATADAKITTFFQEAEPTATGQGDLWVRESTGQLHRWDEAQSDWVPFQDEDIAQAIADAANAQTTADSKIVSYFQDAEPDPTQVDLTVGDLWYKTNAGNRAHWWDGDSWSDVPMGSGAIGSAAIAGVHIQNGVIDAEKLATLITLASRVVAGDPVGARVELNSTGLQAFDAGGVQTVAINSDGSAVFNGELGADIVGSEQIAAGSISAEELSLGSGDSGELLTDPSFEGGSLEGTPVVGNWLLTGPGGSRTGSGHMFSSIDSGDTHVYNFLDNIDVTGSLTFSVSFWVTQEDDRPFVVELEFRYFDSVGTLVGTDAHALGEATDSYRKMSAESVVPEAAATMTPQLRVTNPAPLAAISVDDASIMGSGTNVRFTSSGVEINSTANLSAGDQAPLQIHDDTFRTMLFDSNEIRAVNPDGMGETLFLNPEGRVVLGATSAGMPRISGFEFGFTREATDSNGRITFPHHIGLTPTTVVLTGTDADNVTDLRWIPTLTDASNITVQCTDKDGGELGGGNDTSVSWIAVA